MKGFVDALRSIIVFLTASGLLFSFQLKGVLKRLAVDFSCAINYLAIGDRKRSLMGQFSLLLEHLLEKQPQYRRIHLIAFSFGSLLAIDFLFPKEEFGRRVERVQNLVTIGCPFDIVRTYSPDYFTDRTGNYEVTFENWLNVFHPTDLLASNFRNTDDDGKEAQEGVYLATSVLLKPDNLVFDQHFVPEEFSWINLLLVKGFRMHTSYWNGPDENEISCFDYILPSLFKGDPVLG
jgi:hypothetical protein